jgi:hypothetical protein
MSKEKKIEDFNGDLRQVFDEIFSLRESNVITTIFISLLFLLGSLNALDWNKNYYDDAIDATTAEDWIIEFDIETLTSEHTEVWQDGEVKVIDFFMEDFLVPDDTYIGAINVTVIPEDPGATIVDPLVQCDAVASDIEVNELTAQWSYEGNNLSGQDSSCNSIDMYLQVYPGFTGENLKSDAPNEFQALMPWTIEGWGEGALEVKVELDVNSVDQLGPISQDEDEEITILVEVIIFTTNAVLND